MLKLAILLIAALVAPCLVRAQLNFVYIWNDPNIFSLNKGFQYCNYSSPAWLETFHHGRMSIESVFSDYRYQLNCKDELN